MKNQNTVSALGRRFGKSLFTKAYRYLQFLTTRSAWRERHKKTQGAFENPPDAAAISRHRSLWEPIARGFRSDTFIACSSISGNVDYRYVPEEVFECIIEPAMNGTTPKFLQHKSFYDLLFPSLGFLECYLHKVDGIYFDETHTPIDDNRLRDIMNILEYPVVAKASIDTAGGRDVHFSQSPDDLASVLQTYDSILVQPKLEQHAYFTRFSPTGLNTIRICTYRSFGDHRHHILNTSLRMGKDGSLDNETQGGIVCNIHDDGRLNHYGIDKWGVIYREHPNSGVEFKGQPEIPFYAEMCERALDIAERVPYARLVSLDFALDSNEEWRAIEINTQFQTIRFAQYAGKPFFGKFTEEVIAHIAG